MYRNEINRTIATGGEERSQPWHTGGATAHSRSTQTNAFAFQRLYILHPQLSGIVGINIGLFIEVRLIESLLLLMSTFAVE